jgi:SAM-dependent methyltransferase
MTYRIYQDGRHYDRIFPQMSEDMPFWMDVAQKYGGPILELACGTGRVSIALAREGFHATGLDLSEGMLAEARRKGAEIEKEIEIEWLAGDMRDFELGETFPLIILPANTLGHLLTLEDFEACMSSVKRHLRPGGRFALDMFVPNIELLLDKPGERFPFAEYEDPDGRGTIVITESYVYETDTQIKRITTHHAIPGERNLPEVTGELNLRMYFPQELDALLHYNGFTIEAKYGDLEMSPFGPESERQRIVCGRRNDS